MDDRDPGVINNVIKSSEDRVIGILKRLNEYKNELLTSEKRKERLNEIFKYILGTQEGIDVEADIDAFFKEHRETWGKRWIDSQKCAEILNYLNGVISGETINGIDYSPLIEHTGGGRLGKPTHAKKRLDELRN